ncbi:vitamin K epoxide reductase family protein [Candidatus Kaiserbacteria bacterium]|nr:vitamin K epoxide reductase family protein [Candidatus Kaiserbacteria bacterium]
MPNSNQPSMPLSRPRLFNKLLLAIAAFGFLGFADSAYLTVDHYIALPLPCSLTQGCETVLTSPYSMVGPVPLAFFGVVFYLAVIFAALYLLTSSGVSKLHVQLLFALTGIGLLSSIAFESIQAFIIHAYCMYCAGSALCTLILFILGIALLRSLRGTGSAAAEA